MKRICIMLWLILGGAVLLTAGLRTFQVPDLAGGNEKPAIASNSLGDLLIIYRNNIGGTAYYFQRHDGGTLGPAIVPGQTYEAKAKSNIFVTDIVVTSDDNFHAVWNFDIHMGAWGIYYAVFDITSEQWSSPHLLIPGKIESPKLELNPLNDDLLLVYDNYQGGINKDVFLKVKTAQGWQKEVDISGPTQVPTAGAGPVASGLPGGSTEESIRPLAPHGQLAETNAWVAVDESDGYVYMTWKADKWNEARQDWELLVVVALLDPAYHRVWYARTTRDYEGFHVLPTIAAMDGRAMMAFAWPQEAGYYYLTFVRNGASLIYDAGQLYGHRIAQCPLRPHWEFFSILVPHGDKVALTYKDVEKRINLLHYAIDGTRLDKTPIDLCNHEPSLWPYDCWSVPEIGLLTAWATPREGDASIHYSIFDDPQAVVRSPINLRVETHLERSYFRGYYLNALTWENNPANTARNVPISAHRIYRKTQGQDRSQYVRIGEVSGTTLTYADSDNVGAVNTYDYAVTCVDDKGHESLLR